jgi:enoyl-CoA hydratase/carnithine racemase
MVLRYGRELVVRLLVMGERISAAAALAVGMVSSVTGKDPAVAPPQLQSDNTQAVLSPIAAATKRMIDLIDQDDFDLEYWERIRREILSSKPRFDAVAAFKSRMQSKRE